MARYSRVENVETASRPRECRQTKKNLKENIARFEDDMELIQECMSRDLIDYDKANQAIGRIYMNIKYLKDELKSYKKQGKK